MLQIDFAVLPIMIRFKHFLTVLLAAFSLQPALCQTTDDFGKLAAELASKSLGHDLAGGVLFVGSSTIAQWSSLATDFPDFKIINHGMAGSTFHELNAFSEDLVSSVEPSMVVIYSGDNDIANGRTVDEVADQAERFIDGLRRSANGSLVVVFSVKPSPARWDKKDDYLKLNEQLKTLGDQFEHMVFIDVWSLLLTKKGEPDASMFQTDGLHLNEKGYGVLKSALKPYLTK